MHELTKGRLLLMWAIIIHHHWAIVTLTRKNSVLQLATNQQSWLQPVQIVKFVLNKCVDTHFHLWKTLISKSFKIFVQKYTCRLIFTWKKCHRIWQVSTEYEWLYMKQVPWKNFPKPTSIPTTTKTKKQVLVKTITTYPTGISCQTSHFAWSDLSERKHT